MKETRQDKIREQLKPFRKQIDDIDDKILKLLGERFGVVRKVARIKTKHDIPAYLGDRVREVKERNARTGRKYGVDTEFVRTLYTLIIYQSCATEETIKAAAGKKKKK